MLTVGWSEASVAFDRRTVKVNPGVKSIVWAFALVCVTTLILPLAVAQKCQVPSAGTRHSVETYVIARYRLPSAADVILTDNKQANEACFWLFKYETSNPKREVTVYLSPDANYITPTLYDIRTDPLAEEAAAREQNIKSLLSGTSPELGRKDAPVTIVEFSDFQCPFCKRMADTLRKDFLPGKGDQVRFVFKNDPLPMHQWAMAAAELSECVTLQKPSEFWKVHDFVFENQTQFTAENVKEKIVQFVATNVAIDQAQYQFCVDNDLAMGPVKKDIEIGQKLGAKGTPAIFINGMLYSGFKDAAQLRALLSAAQKGDANLAAFSSNRSSSDVQPGRNACSPPNQPGGGFKEAQR
jgi:protein-disulfide isomerase